MSTWKEQGIKPSGLPTRVCEDDSPHLAILIPAEQISVSNYPTDTLNPLPEQEEISTLLRHHICCLMMVHYTFLGVQMRAFEVQAQQATAASTAQSGEGLKAHSFASGRALCMSR